MGSGPSLKLHCRSSPGVSLPITSGSSCPAHQYFFVAWVTWRGPNLVNINCTREMLYRKLRQSHVSHTRWSPNCRGAAVLWLSAHELRRELRRTDKGTASPSIAGYSYRMALVCTETQEISKGKTSLQTQRSCSRPLREPNSAQKREDTQEGRPYNVLWVNLPGFLW